MNELAVLAEMNGMDRVGAQLEVPLLAEPLERALQVSTIYFVTTTESTQSDVLKPRAN